MAAPPLKSLYKRELLVAPKLAFAMLGCPEVHAGIAERLRDKIKLTSSAPELVDFAALFGMRSVVHRLLVVYSWNGRCCARSLPVYRIVLHIDLRPIDPE